MVDGGAQGPAAEDHSGKPRCPSNWARGAQQDSGPHEKSFLLGRYVEHRGRIRAILSGHVRSCPVCQLVKSDHRKKAGALQPIPLLEWKWQQITTDLVTNLPESEGKTAIAVFVDRLSKMVHFAPCTKEISAEKYAQLFIDHVFKHHGLPEVIISDRDPRFTSRFWSELF